MELSLAMHLGLGPHWYYDIEEMRRDYGSWVTGYTDPKPHRYHAGLKAGQLSQAGIILSHAAPLGGGEWPIRRGRLLPSSG